jgi:predicted transcriptional regulator
MKKRCVKLPNDYPRITIRVPAELDSKIRSIAARSDLSVGQIYIQALRRYLPDLEKFHSAKP